METAALSPKVALVGGGTLAKALLEALERQGVLGSVLGVADPDETAPGVRLARERGLSTTRDFHSLYSLPGLEALVESAGDDAVLEELLRSRPPEVAVIDHTRAKLIAAGALGLAEAALGGASPRGLNLFVRQVLDAIGDGLAILNRDLEVVEFNEAMRRMVDGNWQRCWRGGERPCPECRVRETFETGEPRQATFQACDGRWIELRTYPVRDGQGRVALVIEHTRDVTGREEAVRLLRESEAKHRTLIELTGTGYEILDLEGRVQDANAEFVRLTGHRSLEEVRGRSILEWTAEHDRVRNAEALRAVAAQGFVRSLEVDYVDRAGRITPLEINAAVVETREGPRVLALSRDITERKRDEAALREAERFLASIFTSIQDGVSILDSQFNILQVNPAMERWYAHHLPLVGKKCYEAYHCRTERCERCPSLQTIKTGRPAVEVVPRTGPQGEAVGWLELYAFPFVDQETGQVRGVIEYVRDITERKRAEEALEESEGKYRSLVETTDTGYLIVDFQGRVLDANAEYVRLTGHGSLDEILGRSVLEWTAERDLERNAEEVSKCGRQGFVRDLEINYVDRKGKITPIEVNATVIGTQEGRKIIALCRDITERKRAEEALKESERRFRQLAENIDEVFWFARFQPERMIYVSPAFSDIFGVGPEAIYGNPRLMSERVHPEDRERVIKAFGAWRRGKSSKGYATEYRIVRPGGAVRWLRDRITGVLDDRGKLWGASGLIEDITERKQAVDALAESEERYRVLVENSPDCIKLLDREGRYLAINRAGVEALGRPMAEILGRSYSDDFDPDDREAVRRTVAKAAAGEVASVEGRSAPGAPRPITWLVTLVPLRGPRGEVGRLLGVARDVTGFKRAEEAVRQANEELARLSRLKDEFLSMASHELKTPVTSIKLFCELAQRRPDKVAARLPEVLATINRQADHLVSLVNDLLDVSRLDLGRVRLELEPCDLRDLLDEVCALSRELYASHPLDCQRPEEPVLVRADGSRLIQVLQNLIDNATKYSPAGSPIEVSVEVGAGRVTIAVRDRGAGISAEDLPHIFERFYKSRGQQAVVPGLGLGLYISRELVLRHGGRLWAASRVGEGSTFYIDLPLLSQGPPV